MSEERTPYASHDWHATALAALQENVALRTQLAALIAALPPAHPSAPGELVALRAEVRRLAAAVAANERKWVDAIDLITALLSDDGATDPDVLDADLEQMLHDAAVGRLVRQMPARSALLRCTDRGGAQRWLVDDRNQPIGHPGNRPLPSALAALQAAQGEVAYE